MIHNLKKKQVDWKVNKLIQIYIETLIIKCLTSWLVENCCKSFHKKILWDPFSVASLDSAKDFHAYCQCNGQRRTFTDQLQLTWAWCLLSPEFPPEEMNSQDESALEDTMESEEEEESPKKPRKRKAGAAGDKKVRKVRISSHTVLWR